MEHVKTALHLQEPNWANKHAVLINVISDKFYRKMEHANYVSFILHLQKVVLNVYVLYVKNVNLLLRMENVDTVQVSKKQPPIKQAVSQTQNWLITIKTNLDLMGLMMAPKWSQSQLILTLTRFNLINICQMFLHLMKLEIRSKNNLTKSKLTGITEIIIFHWIV